MHRTLDQLRARQAYVDVRSVASKTDKIRSEYGSIARNLPIMLLGCGLGQTLAYLDSKRESTADAPALILGQLSDWLSDESRLAITRPAQAPPGWLLAGLLEKTSTEWHHGSTEAVAYTTWLKRFSAALIHAASAPTNPPTQDQDDIDG